MCPRCLTSHLAISRATSLRSWAVAGRCLGMLSEVSMSAELAKTCLRLLRLRLVGTDQALDALVCAWSGPPAWIERANAGDRVLRSRLGLEQAVGLPTLDLDPPPADPDRVPSRASGRSHTEPQVSKDRPALRRIRLAGRSRLRRHLPWSTARRRDGPPVHAADWDCSASAAEQCGAEHACASTRARPAAPLATRTAGAGSAPARSHRSRRLAKVWSGRETGGSSLELSSI